MPNTKQILIHRAHIVIVTPVKTTANLTYTTWIVVMRFLGARLNTIHNLRYYQRLMESIRSAIDEDRFDEFVQKFYARRDREVPPLAKTSA